MMCVPGLILVTDCAVSVLLLLILPGWRGEEAVSGVVLTGTTVFWVLTRVCR